ncbi:MAG: citrate lyase acyl carrier protein [Candidatus Izimaplasma sp.]|nr:citrate lyase acyl carrier protein [Candidatus Izimaplasma bacterium]
MNVSAGSYESNDCLITLEPAAELECIIHSVVKEQFGEQIELVLKQTLAGHNITHVKLVINDKGALDYTIKARLETAIRRMRDLDE